MPLISRPLTRMQVHDVFEFDGRLCRVDLVNDCRARCLPITRVQKAFVPKTGENAETSVSFTARPDWFSICPDAVLDIVGRWKPETQSVRFFSDEESDAPPTPPQIEQPPSDPSDYQQQTLI